MSDDNAIPEALPTSSEKRRHAKKPKKAASEPSQENVTSAGIAGSSTQQMGVLLIATPVPNHDMLTKGVRITGPAAVAPPQIVAPLSMKSPIPPGSVASVERKTCASNAMLGL